MCRREMGNASTRLEIRIEETKLETVDEGAGRSPKPEAGYIVSPRVKRWRVKNAVCSSAAYVPPRRAAPRHSATTKYTN